MLEALLGAASIFTAISFLSAVRVYREYERAVVFRMGRARKELAGPGLTFLLPWGIDRTRVVDTRIKVINIPPQEVITRDNITVKVDAIVYATVASPRHAVLEVEDFMPATSQLAATTLRAVLGKLELDEILAQRDTINNEVRQILDTRTEQWGVEITAVELRDIELPREMQKAIARQAEAERERRAKVIAADGEVQAANALGEAARVIAANPGALQLRLYQTLVEVAGKAPNTIVFPVPMDLGAGVTHAPGQLPGASTSAGALPSAGSPQQIAGMMQSAVALTAAQQAKASAAKLQGAVEDAGLALPAVDPVRSR